MKKWASAVYLSLEFPRPHSLFKSQMCVILERGPMSIRSCVRPYTEKFIFTFTLARNSLARRSCLAIVSIHQIAADLLSTSKLSKRYPLERTNALQPTMLCPTEGLVPTITIAYTISQARAVQRVGLRKSMM